MKNINRIVVCVIALLVAGVAYAAREQGRYASHAAETLPEFHSISITGDIEVAFVQQPTFTVQKSGPQSLLDDTSVRVQNGVLEIAFTPKYFWKDSDRLRVVVTGPSISNVSIAGKGDLHVRGPLQLNQLQLSLTQEGDFSADHLTVQSLQIQAAGRSEVEVNRLEAENVTVRTENQADVDLAGVCYKAQLENRGSGDIDADELRVQKAEAVVNGRGDIEVFAQESLTAAVWGRGRVKYKGAPAHLQRDGTVKRIVQDFED